MNYIVFEFSSILTVVQSILLGRIERVAINHYLFGSIGRVVSNNQQGFVVADSLA